MKKRILIVIYILLILIILLSLVGYNVDISFKKEQQKETLISKIQNRIQNNSIYLVSEI